MSLSIRKLHPAIGAEVRGLDLSEPVDEGTVAAVRAAWLEHHVLVFPGQDISDEQHVAFSRNFSDLEMFPQATNRGSTVPEIFLVSNVDENDNILPVQSEPARYISLIQYWHTDSAYRPIPSLGAILHGLEVPEEGGETLFANLFAAYDALPAEKQAELALLRSKCSFEYSRTLKDLPPMKPEELAAVPPVEHPMVRVHEDGRKSLYISPPYMECIVGLSHDDSQALIAELTEFATQDRFVYRHKWSPHDILMWDNRSTMHIVTPYDSANKRRVMHRTSLVGTEAVIGVNGQTSLAAA